MKAHSMANHADQKATLRRQPATAEVRTSHANGPHSLIFMSVRLPITRVVDLGFNTWHCVQVHCILPTHTATTAGEPRSRPKCLLQVESVTRLMPNSQDPRLHGSTVRDPPGGFNRSLNMQRSCTNIRSDRFLLGVNLRAVFNNSPQPLNLTEPISSVSH